VVLILILLGALPTWPYSRSWGYYPSGGLGLVVVVVLVLLLAARLCHRLTCSVFASHRNCGLPKWWETSFIPPFVSRLNARRNESPGKSQECEHDVTKTEVDSPAD